MRVFRITFMGLILSIGVGLAVVIACVFPGKGSTFDNLIAILPQRTLQWALVACVSLVTPTEAGARAQWIRIGAGTAVYAGISVFLTITSGAATGFPPALVLSVVASVVIAFPVLWASHWAAQRLASALA
jgi:hypothetical protein